MAADNPLSILVPDIAKRTFSAQPLRPKNSEKELQGKVENTHKQDDREFYAKYKFNDYWKLETYMRSWNQRWNEQRATKALRWRTPNEVIYASVQAWVAYLLNYQTKHPQGAAIQFKIDNDGNLFLEVPKARNLPEQKKVKGKNMVDRYLSWMDGETKKLKTILVLPTIYQIFSDPDQLTV